MPLYDCKCDNCGREFEVFKKIVDITNIKCECGGNARTLITCVKSKDWFTPHYNEHFTGEPVFVRSRSHMKDLCRKHNVTSRALGDVRNITEV